MKNQLIPLPTIQVALKVESEIKGTAPKSPTWSQFFLIATQGPKAEVKKGSSREAFEVAGLNRDSGTSG